MKISPIVLLFFAVLGCGSGTQTTNPSAESVGKQAQQQRVATPEKQAAKTLDAATVKKHMTPAQLALGDPVVNSVGMVLVPIPAGEFMMGSSDTDKASRRDEKPQHLVKRSRSHFI